MVIAIGINTAECAQKKNWVAMELVHFISSPSNMETSHSTCNKEHILNQIMVSFRVRTCAPIEV